MNARILLGLAGVVVPILAFAPRAEATPPMHAFASVGNADADFRPDVNDAVDDDDQSFELGVGMTLGQHLLVQLSYQDFGSPTAYAGCPPEVDCSLVSTPEPVDIDGWSAAVVGRLPLGSGFSLFGKAGITAWDASAASASLNDSGTDLLYGAGAWWSATDRWGFVVQYEEVNLDIRSVKAGVVLEF